MNTLNTAPIQSAELAADAVEWIVNDNAELGVKIGNQFFFLYKGYSLQYESGLHDDGTPMQWRHVFKREFGECAHPVNYNDPMKIGTVSLADSDKWQPIPAAVAAPSPAQQASSETLAAFQAECAAATKALKDSDAALAAQEQAKPTDLQAVAEEVLSFVDGDLPTRGWLRDNDASRNALHKLRQALAAAPTLPEARELTGAALSWFRSNCPTGWDEACHLRYPAVNCKDIWERALAKAVAKHLAGNTAAKGE